MLLAADYKYASGADKVEPLDVFWAKPGTKIILAGSDVNAVKPQEISADDFFKVQIKVVNKTAEISGVKLLADGKEITTVHAVNSEVN
jgi:methionyl-tRNA synthetase